MVYPPLPSRKRQRDEKNWKPNILKRARNSGKEYVTQSNKKVKERHLKFHHRGRCVNHGNDVLPKHKKHEPQLLEDRRLAAAERLHI